MENGEWESPGWMDIQINGLAGVNFGDPSTTEDQFVFAVERLRASGVTHFLPTLITDALPRMVDALRNLAALRKRTDVGVSVLGFHLEGPFLSPLDGPRGAHPLEHCRNPSWDDFQRLQEAADGDVRLITLAPELEGSLPLIQKISATGVRVALGHTAAAREHILAAVDAGATLATHLGNAAHEFIPRHRNYIFDQLGEDRLWASFIVDGHHLPPHVVQSFVRAKGPKRSILVSDAVQLAGMPVGIYDAGYRQFEVRPDGYIGVFGEPRMAGSGMMLRQGIENVMRFAGLCLHSAVACVTVNPARFLGCHEMIEQPWKSTVRFRTNADGAITVIKTCVNGQTTFVEESRPKA